MARTAMLAGLLAVAAATVGCIPSGVPRSATDPVFPTGAPIDPSGAIRLVSAPGIREVSAAGITARPGTRSSNESLPADPYGPSLVDPEPIARYGHLPSPHQLPSDAPLPTIAMPSDLRVLVGRRDKRDALAAMLGLWRDLGGAQGFTETSGADIVAWASAAGRLADRTAAAQPGDMIVFDRAVTDGTADLIALVVARDSRGVTEIVYLGNGVYRRGFVDVSRPRKRRDDDQRIVNTYLRHGKKWPAKGTRYLAGELIAHVIRMTP